jgi:hypothetical protein
MALLALNRCIERVAHNAVVVVVVVMQQDSQ